jgi:hypothetical protein
LLVHWLTIIAYLRWSSDEQSDGSTRSRQVAAILAFAAILGIPEERIIWIEDNGVSARGGHNLKYGKFAKVARELITGKWETPALVLAEAPDRISRADVWEAVEHIAPLVNRGVSLGFARKQKVVSKGDGRKALFDMLEPLIDWQGSHSENETRAERVGVNVESRRAKALAGETTMLDWVPQWMGVEIRKDSQWVPVPKMGRGAKRLPGERRIVLIPGRQRTLEKIYELAATSMGAMRITKWLNARLDEYPAWEAKKWTSERVYDLLTTDAVTGVWQPHKYRQTGEVTSSGKPKKVREPYGDPKPDYYPAAVPLDLWRRVRRARDNNRAKKIGRPHSQWVNLFTGLCRCGICGKGMYASGNRVRGYSLLCPIARDGAGCDNRHYYRLSMLERAMLDGSGLDLLADALHEGVEDVIEPLAAEITALGQEIVRLGKRIKNFDASVAEAETAEDRKHYQKLASQERRQCEALVGRTQEIEVRIEAARANDPERALFAAVALAQGALDGDLDRRERLAAVVRTVLDRVECKDGLIFLTPARGAGRLVLSHDGHLGPAAFIEWKRKRLAAE